MCGRLATPAATLIATFYTECSNLGVRAKWGRVPGMPLAPLGTARGALQERLWHASRRVFRRGTHAGGGEGPGANVEAGPPRGKAKGFTPPRWAGWSASPPTRKAAPTQEGTQECLPHHGKNR